jgi:hypothetical protein
LNDFLVSDKSSPLFPSYIKDLLINYRGVLPSLNTAITQEMVTEVIKDVIRKAIVEEEQKEKAKVDSSLTSSAAPAASVPVSDTIPLKPF